MKKKILFCIVLVILIFTTCLINFVNAETRPFERFTSMFIKTAEAKPGDKIYVDLYILSYDSSTKIKVYLQSTRQ